jgi:Xaa-Pro aminopeptidase
MFIAFIDGYRDMPSTKRGAKAGDTETAAGQTARVATNARNRQNRLKEKAIDLAVLNLNPDLFYYSGSMQALYMLVPAEGEAVLVARKALERIRTEASRFMLETFKNTKDLQQIVVKSGFLGYKKIGFTMDSTSYTTVNRWLQLFEGSEAVDLSRDIRWLRMVKDTGEQAIFKEAGAIMAHLPQLVRDNFRPGMNNS